MLVVLTASQGLVEYGELARSIVAGLKAGAAKILAVGADHLQAIVIGAVALLVIWSVRLARGRG